MIISRILKKPIVYFTIIESNKVEEAIRLYKSLKKTSGIKEFFIFGNFSKNMIYESTYKNIKGLKFINCKLSEKNFERIAYCFEKCSKFSKRAVYLDCFLYFIGSIKPFIEQTESDKITVLPNYIYEGIHIFDKINKEEPDNINEYRIYRNNFISSNLIIANFKFKETLKTITKMSDYNIFDLFVLSNMENITSRIKIGYVIDNKTIIDRIIVKQNGGHFKLGNTFIYKIWSNRASFVDLICINMKHYKNPSLIFRNINTHRNSVYDQSSHLREILCEYTKIS